MKVTIGVDWARAGTDHTYIQIIQNEIGVMMEQAKVLEMADRLGAKFVHKNDSWFMKFIAILLWPIGMKKKFMTVFWTTIGRTVYYVGAESPLDPSNIHIVHHELIHIKQWDKYWLWQPISYLLFPLPMFFAWFRWRWEREAYLVSIVEYGYKIDGVVDSLWKNYAWTWPKKWMTVWFEEHTKIDPDANVWKYLDGEQNG